jgi:adenine phosphoribosyltransferase
LIFGAPLALALKVPFIPLRKPGKLPGETVFADYITEYSTDRIEMHVGAVQAGQRVVLVDDLIATGGTLREWEQQHSYSPAVDFRFPLLVGL